MEDEPVAIVQLVRTLHFQIGGRLQEGTLTVGNPLWDAGKQKWACSWSISFVHPDKGITYGADPLDAFIRTLDFLSVLLRGSEEDGLEVYWKEQGDHAGIVFPLSEGKKWLEVPPGYKGELPPGLRGSGDESRL